MFQNVKHKTARKILEIPVFLVIPEIPEILEFPDILKSPKNVKMFQKFHLIFLHLLQIIPKFL